MSAATKCPHCNQVVLVSELVTYLVDVVSSEVFLTTLEADDQAEFYCPKCQTEHSPEAWMKNLFTVGKLAQKRLF